jgi:hypothetical protein
MFPAPFHIVQDGLQSRSAGVFVEVFRISFDIDIYCIYEMFYLLQAFLGHKSVSDSDILDAFLFGELHRIISVFEKDGRLIVGVSDAKNIIFQTVVDDLLW